MLISIYDYERIKLKENIREKVDFLPFPFDIKEQIVNILYKEDVRILELLPLDIRFLKERNFVEYNWDYRKPLPL